MSERKRIAASRDLVAFADSLPDPGTSVLAVGERVWPLPRLLSWGHLGLLEWCSGARYVYLESGCLSLFHSDGSGLVEGSTLDPTQAHIQAAIRWLVGEGE